MLPSIAVRNALAYVDLVGIYPSHVHVDTRIACYPYVVFIEDRSDTHRQYNLNEAGRALAAKSTLAPLFAYLAERGFRLWGAKGYRKLKPGFITFRGPGESEAFISRGRTLYIKRDDSWQYDEVTI